MISASEWLGPEAAAKISPLFTQPRPDGQLDLVSEVRAALVGAGLGMQCQNVFDNDRDIRDAGPLGEAAQRHLLNQFWTFQLLQFGSATQNARFHLLGEGSAAEWLELFKRVVLPVLIERQLPTAIH